uniref:Uncharacterized protein n=1 Tax=Rhizophora mucronata TaxID=61149 RepID=A0A2P2NZ18_RHIMU
MWLDVIIKQQIATDGNKEETTTSSHPYDSCRANIKQHIINVPQDCLFSESDQWPQILPGDCQMGVSTSVACLRNQQAIKRA